MGKREQRREARRALLNALAITAAHIYGWPRRRGGKPGRRWAQRRARLLAGAAWRPPVMVHAVRTAGGVFVSPKWWRRLQQQRMSGLQLLRALPPSDLPPAALYGLPVRVSYLLPRKEARRG